MKDFIDITDNDWFAFLAQQPGSDEKRRVHSIYTINVKRI